MPTEGPRKQVLVAGATGRLAAVVDVLLTRGHTVRAMTRDANSTAAERLRRAGAQILTADFDDPDSLAHAAADIDAVIATGTAHQAGPDGELRHGQNLAQAVAEARVPHVVYVSGDGAAADSPLPLFRVKHRVEEQIRSRAGAHTILAPVYFMENLFNPWNIAALQAGVFPSPIDVDLPLQQVAIADVAGLAALAIERPEAFASQRIKVASDELTATDAADALSRVTRRQFSAGQTSAVDLAPGLRALFAWLGRTGHDVDIPALRRHYPEVGWHTYHAWLRSQRPRLEPCPQGHATVS